MQYEPPAFVISTPPETSFFSKSYTQLVIGQ